ncbi:hypothetical protein HKD21_08750 [Gluconobacter cerevisiae]|uniref:Lipoprotein n=1 Tax=Gluconobacter cerevisiae TaxID=1379734 RepID=A0ABR9YE66_9PROT|nr:hypothetical protein [Gluconobacter cerevisiae]MBF0876936.1 hypothetical protein [Gluconobacter cerevisiae]
MTQRFFIVMSLAAGLGGCSHPSSQATDARSALLKPFPMTGSDNQESPIQSDHRIHGAVSVGTGIGGRRNYDPGSLSQPEGLTGAGSGGRGLVPESW